MLRVVTAVVLVASMVLLPFLLMVNPIALRMSFYWNGLYCGLFWLVLVVYVSRRYGPGVFFAQPLSDALGQQQEIVIEEEIAVIKTDLEQDLMVSFQADATDSAARKSGRLVNQGIAEARRLAKRDEEDTLLGDHWCCDGRPIILAIYQVLPATIMTTWIFLGWSNGFKYKLFAASPNWASLSLAIWISWTLLLFYVSLIGVNENFRLGVKRFGKQLNGFLRPGLNFVVPFIETAQSVSLQIVEWGATGERVAEQFSFGGTVGGGNEEPGMFVVPLLGYWPVSFSIGAQMSVYKSYKAAWDAFLNRYSHLNEFGQVLARLILAILNRKAREVEEEVTGEEVTTGKNGKKPDVETGKRAMRLFLNKMPETAGEILQAIHLLGLPDRSGFLIRRLVISAINPEQELRKMLQDADLADMQRLIQERLGEAAAKRTTEFWKSLENVPPEKQAFYVDMAQREVDRVLNSGVAEKGNLVEAFLAKMISTMKKG